MIKYLMLINRVKTVLLLGGLTGILLAIGWFWQGRMGLTIAILIAILMNFGTYWYSDKIVLKMYRAQIADKKQFAKKYTYYLNDCNRYYGFDRYPYSY